MRVLSAYFLLWSCTNLLRLQIGMNVGTGLVGSTLDHGKALNSIMLPLLILAAGIWPARCSGLLPFAAMLMRALTNLAKGSMMSNSQMWATQMDAALMIALVSCALRRPRKAAVLSEEEELEIVSSCARTVRWQLSIFYFASGFWKLNSSFLHPSYSCASIFMVQPLEYLPDSLLFGGGEGDWTAKQLVAPLARMVATTGPALTLVIESIVPLLHALSPHRFPRSAALGVAITLVFHAIIGLTPPPSNVSTYGVTTCTRLFFVFPTAVAAALSELMGGGGRALLLGGAMAGAAAASLAVVAPLHTGAVSTVQGDGTDWHLAYYAALSVLFLRALALEVWPPTKAPKAVEGPSYPKLVGVALVYAFALPTLGLQEKAGCLMFSQLRMHSGSNHYLLPTALLQRAWLDAPASSAFAGGVVRVEATDLSWVGNTFAEHMGERTQRLIREVAGVPAAYVWAAKSMSTPRARPPPHFLRHTLSALGLRRLLATAALQGDRFHLRYTRLHGATGDEAWRVNSTGEVYEVSSDGGGAPLACTKLEGGPACGERELALLAPPTGWSTVLAYFLIPQPNPIVPGLTDEMHCVTWG